MHIINSEIFSSAQTSASASPSKLPSLWHRRSPVANLGWLACCEAAPAKKGIDGKPGKPGSPPFSDVFGQVCGASSAAVACRHATGFLGRPSLCFLHRHTAFVASSFGPKAFLTRALEKTRACEDGTPHNGEFERLHLGPHRQLRVGSASSHLRLCGGCAAEACRTSGSNAFLSWKSAAPRLSF